MNFRISPLNMPGAVPPRNLIEALAGIAEDIAMLPPGPLRESVQSVHDYVAPLAQRPVPSPPLSRDQHCRRVALDLAVKHWADLDCKPAEVLETAQTWATWIRTGKIPEGES